MLHIPVMNIHDIRFQSEGKVPLVTVPPLANDIWPYDSFDQSYE